MNSLQKFMDNQAMVQQDSTSLIQLINFMRAKRPDVYRHSIRVAMLAERIATEMNLANFDGMDVRSSWRQRHRLQSRCGPIMECPVLSIHRGNLAHPNAHDDKESLR